jgi:arylsulfatase A-like enzyme
MVPLAVAAAVVAGCGPRSEFVLPERIGLEEPVADLTAILDPAAAEGGVRVAGLQPSAAADGAVGERLAIVSPPPSRVRFRVAVPDGAVLRFGVGVEGPAERAPDVAGVRFAVSVAGRSLWERVVNPAASRHDRRWHDARVPLPAGDETEIVLATERVGPGTRLAGLAGWSPVRVVRERSVSRQPANPSAPNVLVLLVDTLRADRLGCYGARPSPSPTLDRLAAEGLLFEETVAQAPWTMPSVATLFTGLHPRSHGVVGGGGLWGHGNVKSDDLHLAFLSDALPTLAERVAAAGITTVGVSGNPLVSRATNLARGFETFVELPWDNTRPDGPRAGEINAIFVRWLTENRRHRFFAWLHYMEPHGPYTPAPAFRPAPAAGVRPQVAKGRVNPLAQAVNWQGAPPLPPAEIDHLRRLYDGEIRSFDDELAALLAQLDALGVRGSTVLVVTSDHGEEFQEHGRLKHGPHLYEESIRVPLVLAGPGIAPGRVRAQAQGIDLLPTVTGMLGLPAPVGLPGHDLLAPGLEDGRAAISETRGGIASDGSPAELVAVRAAGWKLVHAPARDLVELFDLARDPGERTNRHRVAPEEPRLLEALARWQATAPPPPAAAGADPGLRDKLRALGYVQ